MYGLCERYPPPCGRARAHVPEDRIPRIRRRSRSQSRNRGVSQCACVCVCVFSPAAPNRTAMEKDVGISPDQDKRLRLHISRVLLCFGDGRDRPPPETLCPRGSSISRIPGLCRGGRGAHASLAFFRQLCAAVAIPAVSPVFLCVSPCFLFFRGDAANPRAQCSRVCFFFSARAWRMLLSFFACVRSANASCAQTPNRRLAVFFWGASPYTSLFRCVWAAAHSRAIARFCARRRVGAKSVRRAHTVCVCLFVCLFAWCCLRTRMTKTCLLHSLRAYRQMV